MYGDTDCMGLWEVWGDMGTWDPYPPYRPILPYVCEFADVVVKFVLKYGRDAHHAMAAADRAPKLYSCEPFEMCGGYWGLKMVVMGCVEGKALSHVPATPAIKEDIMQCVAVLHDLGLAHGDLHEENFIIDSHTKLVSLIDFDMAVCDKLPPSVHRYLDESSLDPFQRILKYCAVPDDDDYAWGMFERDRTVNANLDSSMLRSLVKRTL
ncbi:hypothetical protein E1B28_005601 [Marasmius oreades]|uniref:Aminoglycoside phosphotransferase domain-containing protein n=1 Tax=Marasmius oreades TaxID=181124 RepID=A0A9P7UVT1_9AGAR|nr:uncharacterized protein E1B28_005601 [Marasmius oreades]KAG7094786.1 hypothetical protein E1B28_005601 [Marasmius oreades]